MAKISSCSPINQYDKRLTPENESYENDNTVVNIKSLSEADLINDLIMQLRAIRKSRNLTQQDIALLTGIRFQNISRFERGLGGATLHTLMRYVDALDGKLIFQEK